MTFTFLFSSSSSSFSFVSSLILFIVPCLAMAIFAFSLPWMARSILTIIWFRFDNYFTFPSIIPLPDDDHRTSVRPPCQPLITPSHRRIRVRLHKSAKAVECCCVCMCDMEEGDEVMDLRCGHTFHRACLDTWLHRGRPNCPLCRDWLGDLSTDGEKAQFGSFWGRDVDAASVVVLVAQT